MTLKISALFPFVPRRLDHAMTFATAIHQSGAHRLWQGQAMGLDTHQTFAAIAASGIRMPVGIGVTLFDLSHPYSAAAQAQSLAELSGEPAVVGFGPGSREFQRTLRGTPYARPLQASREYIDIVRDLTTKGTANVDGQYFSFSGGLAGAKPRSVHAGLGVLRSGMARVAGAHADAAITWMTPASYLGEVIKPALQQSATEAGRPTPTLTAIMPIAIDRPDKTAAEIALASNAGHLGAPHYQDMLRQAGASIIPDDVAHNAKSAVDVGAFISGDLDGIVDALYEYVDAGVDEVVLNLVGLFNTYGPRKTLTELTLLLETLVPEFGELSS